ncbi:MAG: cyclic nucleotide-binding domain-containing protein [Leptospiraceae bacterium]|nr:cyclic nucleotide-binding domain-containing protein [Leptospiraceae bacterium]MDW8306601.1 cyclic nucleotide-binding domain-containing protein [Leptospiraceae bacterium]
MSQSTALDIRLFRYKKGATVIIAGTRNPGYFFIVKQGKLTVHSDHVLDDLSVGTFESGETFGLVSGLTGTEFLGTVVAQEDSVLIRVPLAALGRYLRHNRQICLKMLRSYSRELRSLDHSLSLKLGHHPLEGKPEKMIYNADIYLKLGKVEMAKYALKRYLNYAKGRNLAEMEVYRTRAQAMLEKLDPKYELPVRPGNKIILRPDEILFVEDEPNDYFYVIKSGQISISRLASDQELLLAILGPGEIFGEMALLEEHTRLASALAYSEAEVMRLSAASFLDVLGEKILHKIFESLARRIWFGHRRISVMTEEDPLLRIYRYLHLFIEREKIFTRQHLQSDIPLSFGLTELLKMTGLANAPPSVIEALQKDVNLTIREKEIVVHRFSQLEGKILQLQKQYRKKEQK